MEKEKVLERKLELGEILSVSKDIYLKNFKAVLFIVLIVYLPLNTVLNLVGGNLETLDQINSYTSVSQILEGLLGVIASMGLIIMTEKYILAKDDLYEADWQEALKSGLSRWTSCIGTNILAGLIIFGLTLLLVVPGIIWSIYYGFVMQVVVLKNMGGKDALDYSKAMVKGQWWNVFGHLFIFGLVPFVVSLVYGAISAFIPNILAPLTDCGVDLIYGFMIIATTVYFMNQDYFQNTTSSADEFEIKEELNI